MKLIFNILILLSIMSFLQFEQSLKPRQNSINESAPMIKGPVYNPLRRKPYTKYTAKV